MFATVTSCAVVGVEPWPISVEAHVGGGRPGFAIVGLPDAAVREAKERVRAAFAASGFGFPRGRVVVNLSPADLPKSGAAHDLPIALGILAAQGTAQLGDGPVAALDELGLDGSLRPVRGILAATIMARRRSARCLVPANAGVAADDVVVPVVDLFHAVEVLAGRRPPAEVAPPPPEGVDPATPDLAEVRGQPRARWALEVAAAGGHHLLLSGAPGGGKTMLARCLPGLLPPPTPAERRELALVAAAAGVEPPRGVPFRRPHHSATLAALVGGGCGLPRPGEVTLAHRGVLFLDELGEFPPALLDALRQPLEEGVVRIARAERTIEFPARFQLVAATNPCPCGYRDDRLEPCVCSDAAVARYRSRLSGPLLDRLDLRVRVPRLRPSAWDGPPGEASAAVALRVAGARRRQEERGTLNRDLAGSALDAVGWGRNALAPLVAAAEEGRVTARGWDRVRRVARTIADLDGAEVVSADHVAAALELRA